MIALMAFTIAQPFWFWLVIAVLFLLGEVATGSGWLLWPAAAAALLAVATLFIRLTLAEATAVFGGVTLLTTVLGRQLLKAFPKVDARDLNDPVLRIVGRKGECVTDFAAGQGRVFVDGKEWAARAESNPTVGTPVEVIGLDGSQLRVKSISPLRELDSAPNGASA